MSGYEWTSARQKGMRVQTLEYYDISIPHMPHHDHPSYEVVKNEGSHIGTRTSHKSTHTPPTQNNSTTLPIMWWDLSASFAPEVPPDLSASRSVERISK